MGNFKYSFQPPEYEVFRKVHLAVSFQHSVYLSVSSASNPINSQ